MKFSNLAALGLVFVGLAGCQNQMDKYIDDYMSRKGPETVEKAIDVIVKKKREEAQKAANPPIEERLKKRVEVDITGAPIKGAADASIVIVEFSDFECPFCSRVLPTVDKVLEDYKGKVKLAFKHNPLPFHENATPAAKASMAAHRQGKFWEMHDLMFKNQRALNDANYKKWAKELKLDLKKFEADMKDPAIEKMIKADAEFARTNEAGGTPSFFVGQVNGSKVNGVLLVGAQPYEEFKTLLDALLAEKS